MKATAKIQFPTGVKMEKGVGPYFERGDRAKGVAKLTITDVRAVLPDLIEVTFDIDAQFTATMMGDRGRGNPSVCVALELPAGATGDAQ